MKDATIAPETLEQCVREIAKTPVLLVATDFDGTIAPIVDDPTGAEAHREAVVALRSLAAMPQTHVALVSGRALGDLSGRVRDIDDAHLVGSHGSEFEKFAGIAAFPEAAARIAQLAEQLADILEPGDGLWLESKPTSLAFHYRRATEETALRAIDKVMGIAEQWPGLFVRHGKKVIELSVVEVDKGVALQRIRQRVGASAVIFLGDDITDEDAFATLCGPDVSIKIGPENTRARFRASDSVDAARLLARLSEWRAAWVSGARSAPIELHSLLSDQRTVALVDPRGRLAWMCLPRIDSGSVFAELLGGPAAGYFEIAPAGQSIAPTCSYQGDSFVLETTWPSFQVTDYLDAGNGRAFQRSGRTDLVRVIEGSGAVRVAFAPRLDFARMQTRLRLAEGGIVVEGAVDPMVLLAPGIAWTLVEEGRNQTAVAEFDLPDRPVVFELRYGTASLQTSTQAEPARRESTRRAWSSWAATLRLPALARPQVLRSALMLRALCYGPTGAIAAAATTSLPEHVGGTRNWDYRYCWPRDAAIAATALLRLGAAGGGLKLLDWLLGILDHCEPGSLLNPIYTVTGRHLASEGEIAELAGYRGSRPVRFGNAAAHQVQMDVFGPIAELVDELAMRGAALSAEHFRLIESIVVAVERRWREPDHGIWEVRSARRHHVHSKVMCWQTVDRALRVAGYLGLARPSWIELRDEIAKDVLELGWNPQRKAFCAAYGSDDADASTLAVVFSGLLPPGDPRVAGTLALIERELRAGPTVYRYRYDDGLPGIEGGFTFCTTWLIEAYHMVGRHQDARSLFDALLKQLGPTGGLSEQFDPKHGCALGNYPQAYSHAGLISAAIRLDAGSNS